jgi:glycosyltransferase involved in cell wall biosynthesis
MPHADVVHAFSASYTSFLLTCFPVWLISRLRRKAVVLNYHTARSWGKFANSKIVRFVLMRTEKIVVPSAYLAAKFEDAGWNVDVVPNVIGDQFRYRSRCNLQPRILCARNLSRDYGIEVAINAFALVQAQYPNATLTLLGDGPLRHSLEKHVRSLGLSGVAFCGSVPNDQMPQWYDRADVFLNASYVDNAPLSILEAMTSGLPIVTTDAGGIPFIVKHEETGLIAPPGNAGMLAEHVIRLLREPQFGATIAREANQRLQIYRWSSVRPQWLELYREATRTGRQP